MRRMLEFLGETAKLKDRLEKEKGIGGERLTAMVRDKQEEYAGLLSEAAAVFAIAREQGLAVDTSAPPASFTRMADVRDGIRATVRGRVERVHSLKTFERSGRKGCVLNILLNDGTAGVKLALWDHDAERAHAGGPHGIERGDTLEVHNAAAKNGFSGLELSLGLTGTMKKVADAGEGAPSHLAKIRELAEGTEADVVARVLELGERREFERNGKKSSMASCTIGDETGTARLVLWEPASDSFSKLEVNSVVKVEGGVPKSSPAGMELHVNWSARLIVGPRNGDVADRQKIVNAPLKRIGELAEGGTAEVKAKLLEIGVVTDKGFCGNCGAECNGPRCEACGHSDVKKRRFAQAVFVGDDGRELKAEMHGACVLKLLMVRKLADDIESLTVLRLKRAELPGRAYYLLGKLHAGVFRAENVSAATP